MKADSKEKVQHFAADNFLCFGKKSPEAVINFCIVNANRGKAIAEDSEEMQEIVSYIKSLETKGATGNVSPGYDEKNKQ